MYRDTRVRPVSCIDSASRISYRVSALSLSLSLLPQPTYELRCRIFVHTYLHQLSIQIGTKRAKMCMQSICYIYSNCMPPLPNQWWHAVGIYTCRLPPMVVGQWAYCTCVSCIDSCIVILWPYRLVYRLGKKFWISHSLNYLYI